jgi:uncharacterized DUF497 family protein
MNNVPADFDWDTEKDRINIEKHGEWLVIK